jgi:hypothetical protein
MHSKNKFCKIRWQNEFQSKSEVYLSHVRTGGPRYMQEIGTKKLGSNVMN